MLEKIRDFFNTGKVIVIENRKSIEYAVDRIEDINVIIAHFDKFPLISVKHADFQLFKSAAQTIFSKNHLN